MLSTKYSVIKTKDFCYKIRVTGRADGRSGFIISITTR